MDMDFGIVIFADGASSGNPGPGGWGAIVVTREGMVTEIGGRESPTTNNRMELTAVLVALERLGNKQEKVSVFTDSTYVIRGITQWIWGWRKNGWLTSQREEVANKDLWQRLFSVVAKLRDLISWHYVRGHSGVPGNERVDQIAVEFSRSKFPDLYSGPLIKYSIPVFDLPENTDLPEPRPIEKNSVEKKAYSYLSLVNGVVNRHSNWKDCEGRVKGRSGAKFKKAVTEQDEASILREWGFSVDDVKKPND